MEEHRKDMHANTLTQPCKNAHTHILVYTHTYKQRKKIHDYWQLSPSIKVFFFRSEGVFIREMRQGKVWVKASITAFISPLQQRDKNEEEETQRKDQRATSFA